MVQLLSLVVFSTPRSKRGTPTAASQPEHTEHDPGEIQVDEVVGERCCFAATVAAVRVLLGWGSAAVIAFPVLVFGVTSGDRDLVSDLLVDARDSSLADC